MDSHAKKSKLLSMGEKLPVSKCKDNLGATFALLGPMSLYIKNPGD